MYLSPNDFSRDYAVYDTYFVDPASQHLVPNPIYLPVGASQATSLVQALLSGPAPWLAPAVRTAFPPGTRLTVPSAPVKDNIVQVDLTEQVRQASADDVQLLGAQLAWTLAQLDDVNAVRITAGGLPGQRTQRLDRDRVVPFRGRSVRSRRRAGHRVAGGRLVTLGEPTLPLLESWGAAAPASSTRRYRPAAGTPVPGGSPGPDGATELYVGDAAEDGTLRIRLQGQVWSRRPSIPGVTSGPPVSPSTGPRIWVVSQDGAPRQVIAPEIGTRTVRALRIARDGVRAAVILRSKKGHELYVGHVVRSGDEVRLDGLHRVESVLTDVTDVAWATADNLLVLGEQQGGGLQPYLVEPLRLRARDWWSLSRTSPP